MHNDNANNISDLAVDLENWMTKLPKNLRAVSIKNLAIPGSHDSFTSDITRNSEVSPDGQEILKILEKLAIAKLVISNWSKTQAFNAVEQLQAGIRYFDLRICRDSDDNNIHFCHGMYSTDVKSVLNDMLSFLKQHTQEVVILDCQHFYDFNTATHNEVIQLLNEHFGNILVPYQSNMESLTLEYLASQKKQVIVIYRDSSQAGQNLLWPTESFPTPWYDTMNSSKLIPNLNNGIRNRSPSVAHVSQCILTPQVNDILGNLLSSLRQKCALDFENTRTEWISNQTPNENGVNIIIADFIGLSDNLFPKTVINLNLKLLKQLQEESGVFGTMRWLARKIKNIF